MLNKRIEYDAKVPIRAYVSRIYEQPVHNHLDDLEIIVVLKGSVKEIVGYRTILLKEGEVMIINDREIHGIYETEEDNLVLTIHLNVSYFKKFNEAAYSDFFLMAATYLNDMRYDRPVEELREKLFDIARVQITQSGSDDKMDTLGKELLAKLLEDFQYFYYSTAVGGYFINKFEGKNNQAQAARIRSLMYYLWENYSQKITLQEYADENHINMYYLSHIIKEATGLNFQDLLNFTRVEESEPLLLETNKKISEIAFDCGFSATRYYVKHFEKWFHVSPDEYRAKHLERVTLKVKEDVLDGDGAINAIDEFSGEKRYLVSSKSHYYTKVLEFDLSRVDKVRRKGFSQMIEWELSGKESDNSELDQICNAFRLSIPVKRPENLNGKLRAFLQEDSSRTVMLTYDEIPDERSCSMTDAMAGFIRNAELASIQINMKFPAGYPEHQKDNLEEIFKEAGRESGCKVQVRDVSSLSKKAFSNNYILDSIYAVPWIIRSNLKKGHEQKFINAVYDSDKEAGMLHGGNGIITVNNIKKPAYYAYMCLSRLGDEIIYNSEGYIVTKRNQDIIVLLYDYDSDCFVDAEEYSDWKTLADFKPVTEKNMEYKLDFSNLQGKYTVTELRIGSDMCLFRKMAEMGMPETLMPEEERCMRYFLGPQLDFAVIESSGGTASMEVKVPKYGATLLQLHKTIV